MTLTKEYIENIGWNYLGDKWVGLYVDEDSKKRSDIFQYGKGMVRIGFCPDNFNIGIFRLGVPPDYTPTSVYDGNIDNTEDFVKMLIEKQLF